MTATLTPTEAGVVMARDHWQCVLCGTTRSLYARPRSGPHSITRSPAHWVTLCDDCTTYTAANPRHARRFGLLLCRQDLPEDVPVRVWTPDGHTRMHLTHDGRRRQA